MDDYGLKLHREEEKDSVQKAEELRKRAETRGTTFHRGTRRSTSGSVLPANQEHSRRRSIGSGEGEHTRHRRVDFQTIVLHSGHDGENTRRNQE